MQNIKIKTYDSKNKKKQKNMILLNISADEEVTRYIAKNINLGMRQLWIQILTWSCFATVTLLTWTSLTIRFPIYKMWLRKPSQLGYMKAKENINSMKKTYCTR